MILPKTNKGIDSEIAFIVVLNKNESTECFHNKFLAPFLPPTLFEMTITATGQALMEHCKPALPQLSPDSKTSMIGPLKNSSVWSGNDLELSCHLFETRKKTSSQSHNRFDDVGENREIRGTKRSCGSLQGEKRITILELLGNKLKEVETLSQ